MARMVCVQTPENHVCKAWLSQQFQKSLRLYGTVFKFSKNFLDLQIFENSRIFKNATVSIFQNFKIKTFPKNSPDVFQTPVHLVCQFWNWKSPKYAGTIQKHVVRGQCFSVQYET